MAASAALLPTVVAVDKPVLRASPRLVTVLVAEGHAIAGSASTERNAGLADLRLSCQPVLSERKWSTPTIARMPKMSTRCELCFAGGADGVWEATEAAGGAAVAAPPAVRPRIANAVDELQQRARRTWPMVQSQLSTG